MTRTISLIELDKFLRLAGAERVDERASRKLGEILEDHAKQLIEKARVFARHAKRNKVSRKDILLAARQRTRGAPRLSTPLNRNRGVGK